MKKVYEVAILDNYLFRDATIISRKEMNKSELDKEYPERTTFTAKDDDDVLVLKIGELVVVPYTNAADAPIFSVYTALQ